MTTQLKRIAQGTQVLNLGMGCIKQVSYTVEFDPSKLDTAITRAALNKSKKAIDANGALIIRITK